MVKIKVPATTANFGPGFDSIGLALNIYQYTMVENLDGGLRMVEWQGSQPMADDDNYVLKALNRTLNIQGKDNIGYKLIMGKSEIPMQRGLGSSAAAIVSGIMAANYVMDMHLSTDDIIDIAVSIEGHPDNVVPAITGGMAITAMENGKPVYGRINFPDDLLLQAFIPDFTLSTEISRKALPIAYETEKTVHNISRSALLVHALHSGQYHLLKTALCDEIHEPYRLPLIEDSQIIMEIIEKSGAYGKFLSGAGPVIMAVTNESCKDLLKDDFSSVGHKSKWEIMKLKADKCGARYENI